MDKEKEQQRFLELSALFNKNNAIKHIMLLEQKLADYESNLVEARVSPTEPTQPQQVFTIEEVKGWLKQQRANCASAFMDYDNYVFIKQNTRETISTLKRDEIFNAPEPKIIRTI